eukprot:7320207-Pyramimonas_sp.AAC.1
MLDAAFFWASIAGDMAADDRADISDKEVAKQANKIQLHLAAHEVIEVPNGGHSLFALPQDRLQQQHQSALMGQALRAQAVRPVAFW